MSEPIESGAKARVVEATPDLSSPPRSFAKGYEFVVDDYVSAEESEDGQAFYWGSSVYGVGDVAVAASAVVKIMSASDMARRRPPTLAAIRRAVACDLLIGHAADFTLDETDASGGGDEIDVYGETDDGLRFGFTLTVSNVYEVLS